MIPYLPYLQILAGFWLLYICMAMSTKGAWYGFMYKFAPFILGIISVLDAGYRLGFIIKT